MQQLRQLPPVTEVEDLTDAYYRQLTDHASDGSGTRPATNSYLFRIVTDHASFLVGIGQDQFHADSGDNEDPYTWLSTGVQTALSEHRGWISVRLESTDGTLTPSQRESSLAEIAAALWPDNCLLVATELQVAVATQNVRDALRAGCASTPPHSEYSTLTRPMPGIDDDMSRPETRQRLLKDRLKRVHAEQPSSDLDIIVRLDTPSGAVPLACHLIRWEREGRNLSLVIELPNHDLVSPAVRGEYISVSDYSMMDWTER